MATATPRKSKRVRVPTHYPDQGTASVREAMQFLGIKRNTIYKRINAKEIPSWLDGGKRCFDWADLWAYRDKLKAGA